MKRWSFIVDITDVSKKTKKEKEKRIEEKVKEVVKSLGGMKNKEEAIFKENEEAIFKVSITFYQATNRWKKENPQIPREDTGIDLDNLIKPVFDGLGPIIGYRKKWQKNKETGKTQPVGTSSSADSRIVEVYAKKVNSGTKKEYLSIEVEKI